MNKPTVERMRQELSANERKQNLDRFLKDSAVQQRMYTGTSKDKDFSKFNVPKNGAWFTPSTDDASAYAKVNDSKGLKYDPDSRRYKEVNTADRVMPVYLKAVNPYQIKDDDIKRMNVGNYKKAQSQFFDSLRSKGHDSALFNDGTTVILKGAHQIKSAIGNRGTYDPNDPDITKADGGSVKDDEIKKTPNLDNMKREILSKKQSQENLDRFLKDSVVKSRLYHGTTKSFSVFDPKYHGEKDHGWYGIGHYLTADPETASAYSVYDEMKDGSPSPGANVMPVYVKLKNPYIWPKNRKAAQTREEAEAITNELKKEGYDGVVVPNEYQHPDYAEHHEVVAFHPHQIKSAIGNRGTYDPNNPDITKASGGVVSKADGGSVKPKLIEDIPNESWLKGKVDYAQQKGRNRHGVPHMSSITGYYDKPVHVSLRVLSKLRGQSNEQQNVRPESLDYIRKNWKEVSKEHPYIEVAHNGEAWVSEGNHRIMVANEKGLDSMPVEIRYFDGGQRRNGPLHPSRIPSLDKSIVEKAQGGTVQGGDMPTLAEMRAMLMRRGNPIELQSIGVNEAPGMNPKAYLPPDQPQSFQPAPGGVALKTGMPIGGVDQSRNQQGSQLMPQQIQQTDQPQGNMPGQQPNPMPTGFGQSGSTEAPPAPAQGPSGNILSMTPQGRALGAIGPAQKPQGMANGGGVEQQGVTMSSPKSSRLVFQAEGSGGVKGINVPRHMWEGSKTMGGMKDINAARATVYGSENRDPLTIGQIGKIHKQTLDEHFEKPIEQQIADEKAALGRLREAKHIGKTANTLDESEKLDTVRHEHDEEGRTHVGYASKGVAGHALYTSGYGKDMKHHVINTCPGQTEGCGGGKDANGIVNTTKGTCFAPVAESQYPGAAIRRASHEQAKHDPAMTRDWILAHTGSIREAANKADKNNQRMLFRPNVVDETDTSSRHVIRHLNEQRKQEDKPGIIANSYGKTNELHDPENGYYVTHSNVGPKVKKGQEITENIGRDRARVRNTIMAADNRGDFTNEQGNKTPPKGSYMVTDVKRGSPLSKKMEENITHAKYWTTGREERELSDAEKEEGPEGHYGPNGKPTIPEKAHYGHTTINGRRYDYQKQHILHPRLVQVGENKDGTPHMIPTDSRFKDTDFLPKNRFKTKNGKDAGHILMTTPTESTSNLAHDTSFTHHVNESHIKHAMNNNGEYEIDKPEDQEKARGKEYAAPQPINIVKKAMGGIIESRHSGLSDDDFHAFPERNLAAQRHLAKRHGDDEDRPKKRYKGVVVHKNTNTMRHEMMMRRKG